MKKLFVILLTVLLLVGCEQTNPEETTVPTTEPTTQATTAPTTVPTTAPTTAPTETISIPTEPTETTEPPENDSNRITRIAFVFSKRDTDMLDRHQLPGRENLKEGYLYLADLEAKQIYPITDRPLYYDPATSYGDYKNYVSSGSWTHVSYVLEDEPNKIYRTPIADITQTTLVYESEAGPITALSGGPWQYMDTVLQWIEEYRRYVWFDIPTATAEVLLELPYMLNASADTENRVKIDGEDRLRDKNKIVVWGQLHEGEEMDIYLYDRVTGNFGEYPYGCHE